MNTPRSAIILVLRWNLRGDTWVGRDDDIPAVVRVSPTPTGWHVRTLINGMAVGDADLHYADTDTDALLSAAYDIALDSIHTSRRTA